MDIKEPTDNSLSFEDSVSLPYSNSKSKDITAEYEKSNT